MKLNIKYIDNNIEFEDQKIWAIEIENKIYFYRLVKDLYSICNGNLVEDIFLLDSNQEINIFNKIKLFIDFFDFNLDSRKYINEIVKFTISIINNENRNRILNQYKKLTNIYKKIVNEIDLPLSIESEIDIENITKLIKINIKTSNNLLENLFILIDLENLFQTKNLLIFINLKQYLTKQELEELYKYSIYNEIPLLLIDSQCYGTTLNNERKLIIDDNLDEVML